MEIIVLARNVKPSSWNKGLSWKHCTKKVASTCPFVANKMSVYILLKTTTVIELLEFHSTNNRKIKSLLENFIPKYTPPTNLNGSFKR